MFGSQPITNPIIDVLLGSGPGNLALAVLMARLFRILIILGGLAMLLFFAWGGLSWILAGGDKGKVEAARERITNSILGMAVLVATIAVALLLKPLFGFDLLNPVIPGSSTTTPGAPGTPQPTLPPLSGPTPSAN